jgi:hypothetical protein
LASQIKSSEEKLYESPALPVYGSIGNPLRRDGAARLQ